jgi:hypothetical protein
MVAVEYKVVYLVVGVLVSCVRVAELADLVAEGAETGLVTR